MGLVESILQSKLSAAQASYNRCASRAGFLPKDFSAVFAQAQVAKDTSPKVEAGAQVLAQASGAYAAAAFAGGSAGIDTQYEGIIDAAAAKYGLDPALLKGMIRVESNFHKDSVSRSGAMGLMQLMPGTAKSLGVKDAFDPEQNIFGGAAYIRRQLNRFGDIRLALAAYNTGPHRVGTYNIKDPDDTAQYARISKRVRNYVKKVLSYRDHYAGRV